jgi:3'-phosphoadenosine 5'-phosphosulfate sulfotransferase (PAPS reductase)/FAD synthetase
MTGVRAIESRARKLAWLQRGALYYSPTNGQWVCNPLSYWTAHDVARYIEEHDVPFTAPPFRGSGCVGCGFGCHLASAEGQANNLQQLYNYNRRMWQWFVDDLGMGQAFGLMGVPVKP